jgi:hypothetical protein
MTDANEQHIVSTELFSDDDTPEIREAKIWWEKEFGKRVKIMEKLMAPIEEDLPTPQTSDE